MVGCPEPFSDFFQSSRSQQSAAFQSSPDFCCQASLVATFPDLAESSRQHTVRFSYTSVGGWLPGLSLSEPIMIRLLETRQSALSALFFRIFSSFSFVFALLSKAIETDKPLSVLMHRLGGIVTSEDTLTSNELLLETSSFNVYKRKNKFQSKQKQNNSHKQRQVKQNAVHLHFVFGVCTLVCPIQRSDWPRGTP